MTLHDKALLLKYQRKEREEPFDYGIVHITRRGPE